MCRITIIKSSFGSCHEDPGNPVSIDEISFIYCPIPNQSPQNTP